MSWTQSTYHKIKPFHGRPLCSARRVTAPVERLIVVIGATMATLGCRQCGRSFNARPYQIGRGRRYCSRRCADIARSRQAQIDVVCSRCGKVFPKKRCDVLRNKTGKFFCTEQCYLNNKHCDALDDKALLQHLYDGEQNSLSQIADQLDTDISIIWAALREHGIRTRKPGYNKFNEPNWLSDKAELQRLYQQLGLSLTDIARIAGCTAGTIAKRMQSLNICRRTAREVGASQKGSNGPNWKGGLTPDKVKWINSLPGRKWTMAIYRRGGWTCELCEEQNGGIEAHHIFPYADFPNYRGNVDNGICLCTDCHRKTHSTVGKQLSYWLREERRSSLLKGSS